MRKRRRRRRRRTCSEKNLTTPTWRVGNKDFLCKFKSVLIYIRVAKPFIFYRCKFSRRLQTILLFHKTRTKIGDTERHWRLPSSPIVRQKHKIFFVIVVLMMLMMLMMMFMLMLMMLMLMMIRLMMMLMLMKEKETKKKEEENMLREKSNNPNLKGSGWGTNKTT